MPRQLWPSGLLRCPYTNWTRKQIQYGTWSHGNNEISEIPFNLLSPSSQCKASKGPRYVGSAMQEYSKGSSNAWSFRGFCCWNPQLSSWGLQFISLSQSSCSPGLNMLKISRRDRIRPAINSFNPSEWIKINLEIWFSGVTTKFHTEPTLPHLVILFLTKPMNPEMPFFPKRLENSSTTQVWLKWISTIGHLPCAAIGFSYELGHKCLSMLNSQPGLAHCSFHKICPHWKTWLTWNIIMYWQ